MNGLIPGLPHGWIAADEIREKRNASELQRAQGLMQLQGLLAKRQQEQAFRSEISQAQTPEQQVAVAAKYMGPDALARMQQGSLDRQATLQAANTNATALREQRLAELQLRGQQRADEIEQRAREGRITAQQAAADRAALQQNMARLAASLRQPVQPRQLQLTTDSSGNQLIVNPDGTTRPLTGAGGQPVQARPPVAVLKEQQARAKMNKDLDLVIPTLEEISKEGGLIDQSTGSGAGALRDMAAGFFGQATDGSIAVGRLKPLVDPILKLVPRFEGPQSDKDTQSYRDAAGDLANPATPNARKKAAAKEILGIYKRRRNQFITKDYEAAAIDTGTSPYAGPDRRAPSDNKVIDFNDLPK